MWARVVEVMLGCWLSASPFIFRYSSEERALWNNDFLSAFIVVALALLSFWRPSRHAHLLTVIVSIWLIGFGYLRSPPPTPPALQNDIMVGWLLLMFAIIPNEASLVPHSWRLFSRERAERRE